MVESTTVIIEEREKEIRSIVQSISEINEMYRDLATLIVDQVHTPSLPPSLSLPSSLSPSLSLSPPPSLPYPSLSLLYLPVYLSLSL